MTEPEAIALAKGLMTGIAFASVAWWLVLMLLAAQLREAHRQNRKTLDAARAMLEDWKSFNERRREDAIRQHWHPDTHDQWVQQVLKETTDDD